MSVPAGIAWEKTVGDCGAGVDVASVLGRGRVDGAQRRQVTAVEGRAEHAPWKQVRGLRHCWGCSWGLQVVCRVREGVPPTVVTRPAGSEGEAGPHPGAPVSPGLTHVCLRPLGGCSCPDSRSEGPPFPGSLLPTVWTSPGRTCPLLTKRAGVGQSLSTEGKAGP